VRAQAVDATPSDIDFLAKVVFMTQCRRFRLSAAQKSDLWCRWKTGDSLHEIGRAFGKEHSSIRCLGRVCSGGAHSSRNGWDGGQQPGRIADLDHARYFEPEKRLAVLLLRKLTSNRYTVRSPREYLDGFVVSGLFPALRISFFECRR
jgi:hypothetical protein